MGNRSRGLSPDELKDVAVGALVREWGVTAQEARAAINRVREQERRLRRNGRVITLDDPVVDLTDPGPGWVLYLDHGSLVYGRVE